MSRAAALAFFLLMTSLGAQESPPAAVSLPPPPVPDVGAPVVPVAPPMPGQLQAAPALPPPAPGNLSPVSPGPGQAPATPPPEFTAVPKVSASKSKSGSSTSTTGQFIVHGDDLTLRSALSSKCEDISSDLRTLLNDKQSWVLPIVVLLNSGDAARKSAKTVSTVISQLTHGGFHLQVNVNMRPDLKPEDLRKEVIRALLAERILRDQKEITAKRKLLLPDWLFLGILEALDYRQRARPSTLFAAIFKSGKIFGIEEIIEASASDIDDALSKSIYQTSCCALVLALLDQPDSGLRMGKFLNALAGDPRSERELLNQWFPNFASSEASLNKWWALQLATLASPSMAEPLSPLDTLAALEDALIFRYRAKPSEIPQSSRRVMATVKPAPARPRSPTTPSTDAEAPEAPPEEAEEAIQERRGFISRLNPFSRRKTSDDEIAAAIEEAARAEAESAPPEANTPAPGADLPPESPTSTAAAPSEGGRKPLLNRWFGEDDKPQDPITPEPQATPKSEKTAAAKPEAPKVKPAEESTPKAEKKPSNLNPMNWFRGGKKDPAEPSPDEETPKEEKDKKAALSAQPDPIAAQLSANLPIIALVYQEIAVETEEEPKTEKRRFFGLLGKKKAEDDPAEPEAPKKPEDKKDIPPAPEPQKAKDAEKPEEPMTEEEEAQSESDKPKRQPLRLRLFGSDKKDDEAADKKEEPQEEMPVDAPEAPASEPARPKPVTNRPKAPQDETPVAAAIPIEDYAAILKRKDLSQIIERNANALAVLQNRGSVLFRPVVNDYITALEDILKGRTKGLDERLRTLRARTQQALEKSNAVRDLLDLHEANDSPAMSGLFEDYLKLPQTIQNELPPRTDPISKYLDALDKEFSKE